MTHEGIDARIIANAVLDRAEAAGRPLTNLDVQKLVYFVHGHYLTRYGQPLVRGEFEAWQFGPVHRVLYDTFRSFEAEPIEGRASGFDPVRRRPRDLASLADPNAIAVLDDVLHRYLDLPTFTLVEMTHARGTPWSLTIEAAEREINLGMRISNDLIKEFFEGPAEVRAEGLVSRHVEPLAA